MDPAGFGPLQEGDQVLLPDILNLLSEQPVLRFQFSDLGTDCAEHLLGV